MMIKVPRDCLYGSKPAGRSEEVDLGRSTGRHRGDGLGTRCRRPRCLRPRAYGRLVGLARLVCRDSSEAGDAVQAALEQAWRQRTAFVITGLATWLDRIVVREAIRLDRRRRSPLAQFLQRPTGDPDRHDRPPHCRAARLGSHSGLPSRACQPTSGRPSRFTSHSRLLRRRNRQARRRAGRDGPLAHPRWPRSPSRCSRG